MTKRDIDPKDPSKRGKKNNTVVKLTKGDVARQKILAAARIVFSQYPYDAASIRMIGTEGGFDHPIVNYYFPTKGELFETILIEVCTELMQANIDSLSGADKLPPRDGLGLYIDRFLDYNFKNPVPLKIIMLNVVKGNNIKELPGHQHIHNFFREAKEKTIDTLHFNAPPEEIGMFSHSFNMLLMSFLAASDYQAQALGMDPESNAYRIWVKEAMIHIFLPTYAKLINPGQ